jgi:hypothetical protein
MKNADDIEHNTFNDLNGVRHARRFGMRNSAGRTDGQNGGT